MKPYLLTVLFILLEVNAYTQENSSCKYEYGTLLDKKNIAMQMRYGSITDAIQAIDKAKNTRGNSLGCPITSYTHVPPLLTPPSIFEIKEVWKSYHEPFIKGFSVSCPAIGRYENNSALGAYYAMQAGCFNDTLKLAEIADMMYDQQYAEWNGIIPNPRNEGVYAYINTSDSDPCYPGGVVGASVKEVCDSFHEYCICYTKGQFAGLNFLTSAQDDESCWFDGGLAYDHAWVGVQMIESAIMQSNPILKKKYRASVELASQYAISEYCVKNHNYTAKLIWLLAEMYAWTGNPTYRNELNYKINKSLIPGILWDGNDDGFVDGTSPSISFDSLTFLAQTPGRMWDGHNSQPWYHAMNAWALVEAYVAFRDQGDVARANELKPYALSMLDNLSNEIITLGTVNPNVPGVRDMTYALLIGIWKIAHYENELHTNWEQAAWAMWNTGYFHDYSTHTVCVGLYLIVRSATPYHPLFLREDFMLSANKNDQNDNPVRIFPKPCNRMLNIGISQNVNLPVNLRISDMLGRKVMIQVVQSKTLSVDISRWEKGVYVVSFFNGKDLITSLSFTKR